VREVVVLSLAAGDGCDDAGCREPAGHKPRVPVLTCVDSLISMGTPARSVTACSDQEIDAALKPISAGEATLIVAAATDGQLRAVLRRMVRLYAPAPSKRPADLPADRTVPDLPPIGVLPLLPAVPDLVAHLGLPTDSTAVARAVAGGRTRRFDLLRHDGGSITLHGVLIGGMDEAGQAVGWEGRIEVDDTILTDGDEPILACAIANTGTSIVDGVPIVVAKSPDDGLVEVAIAVPHVRRRLMQGANLQVEVRRVSGRAVSVLPRGTSVPMFDDGIADNLTRKRSWWVERALWAAFIA